jgi:ABC-type antimicrobial peptide transport system permease subunit
MTVVGVVSDARQRLGAEATDEIYRPLLQQALLEVRIFARSSVPAGTLERQLREAVRRVDPQQPIESFQTLDDVRNAALASPRLTAMLLGVFALIALVISATGLAGVVSFSVNQRTREFGTVLALGASPSDVLGLVLKEGAVLAGVGLVLGAIGAALVSRAMTSMLFGITAFDPVTFIGVALLLAVVTMAAALAPARRAANVDPLVALQAN